MIEGKSTHHVGAVLFDTSTEQLLVNKQYTTANTLVYHFDNTGYPVTFLDRRNHVLENAGHKGFSSLMNDIVVAADVTFEESYNRGIVKFDGNYERQEKYIANPKRFSNCLAIFKILNLELEAYLGKFHGSEGYMIQENQDQRTSYLAIVMSLRYFLN